MDTVEIIAVVLPTVWCYNGGGMYPLQITRSRSSRAVAAFMSIWLSGAFFLFLCAGPSSAATEHCPLARSSSHCDHGGRGAAPSSFDRAKSDSVDCCAFIPVLFDKVRTGENGNNASAAVTLKTVTSRPRTLATASK